MVRFLIEEGECPRRRVSYLALGERSVEKACFEVRRSGDVSWRSGALTVEAPRIKGSREGRDQSCC